MVRRRAKPGAAPPGSAPSSLWKNPCGQALVLDHMGSLQQPIWARARSPLAGTGGWPTPRNENAAGKGRLVGRQPGCARLPPHKRPLSPLRANRQPLSANCQLSRGRPKDKGKIHCGRVLGTWVKIINWTLDKVWKLEKPRRKQREGCYILWLSLAEPQYIASFPPPSFPFLTRWTLSKVLTTRQFWIPLAG